MDSLTRLLFGFSNPWFGMCFAEGDAPPAGTPPAGTPPPPPADFKWKGSLNPDFANSPTMQKYEDTKDGFNNAVRSFLDIQQMLGRDKVIIPKGPDDVEGWNAFQKAMGIPDRADQYGLSDADIPPGMKDVAFDKKTFAEKVHAFKLTPSQAKGLWETYTTMVKDIYQKAVDSKNQQMTQLSNRLRGEWADAYETKVEMGQMVINKFASDQDAINFVTAAIAADPRGVKFLAKIGEQFAENKIGDFAHKRYSFTPDEAQAEINKITADPNHPYNNEKALAADHQRAVDYVNSLYSILSKAKTG